MYMIISFKKTPFHSHLNSDLLLNMKETKNSDESVNSNQIWNNTNDECTSYGGM